MQARTSPLGRGRPFSRALITSAASAAAILGIGGAVASAQSAGAAEPSPEPTGSGAPATAATESSAPAPSSADGSGGDTNAESGATGGSGEVRALRLRAERVAPRKAYFAGVDRARFRFEIGGGEPRNLVIEVVRRGTREVVQRWQHDDVEPGETYTQVWGGRANGTGVAKSGRYLFRVRERGGALAERSSTDGQRSFHFYDHIFPVRGKHGYGDGLGAGRGHQGQDVFAKCGTPLVAARAGKVRHKGYHGRAGRYLVVKGRNSRWDYVYMHLRRKSPIRQGKRVKTGQRIGVVGQTGNARGCHLHFELWSKPGWYRGGSVVRSVTKQLRKWDSWG